VKNGQPNLIPQAARPKAYSGAIIILKEEDCIPCHCPTHLDSKGNIGLIWEWETTAGHLKAADNQDLIGQKLMLQR